jgi:3-hydroxyacyl-[acyl-carrier-protein] dehydratase
MNDAPAAPTESAEPAASVLLSTAELQALIPHRWPFLLVDRVVEEDRERRYIRAEKAVTATEWFFGGHFPGLPVLPGVIQVEALAQTMAVYVAREPGFGDRIGLFAGIDECRFKRIVQPGDRMTLEVTMEKLGRRFGRGRGVASVDGEVCCEALISFVIPPAEALR